MFLSKAKTFKLAYDLGGRDFVKLIVEKTHTCYESVHDKLHHGDMVVAAVHHAD